MMAAVQPGQHELFGNELWERERMTVEIIYDVVSSHVSTAHKIRIDARPYVASSNELLGCSYPLV